MVDGLLCKSVLDSLKRWEFEVNPTSEDDISPQGRMDMQLMAKRTRDKLSEILVKEINQNTFKVNKLLYTVYLRLFRLLYNVGMCV